MISKFKKILGIEGVKVQLEIPETFQSSASSVSGNLLLSSLSDQKIEKISIRLIEKYARGRKESQLIDEYVIGEVIMDEVLNIESGEQITKAFTMPYEITLSEMDLIENKNFLYKGIVKMAKYLKKVKSTYRIEIDVKVKGTRLNPSISREIKRV